MWRSSFEIWQELVVRSLVAETFGLAAESEPDPVRVTELKGFVGLVGSVMNQPLPPQSAKPPLEYATEQRLERLKGAVLATAAHASIIACADDALGLAKRRACTVCCDNTQRCCEGRSRELDYQQAQRVGLCFEVFHETRKICEAIAERRYGPMRTGGAVLELRWTLKNSTSPRPHGLTPAIALSGACGFADVPEQRLYCSDIELQIGVKHVDWPTLAALPYVALHELLCHGYQGCARVGPRRVVPSSCRFAEGWLDYVAFGELKAALATPELFGIETLMPAPSRLNGWEHYGDILHKARYADDADRFQLKYGMNGARNFERFMRREGSAQTLADARWPEARAREFALALNALRDDSSEPEFAKAFQLLVRAVTLVTQPGEKRGSPLSRRFWSAVEEFMANPVLSRLIERLRQMEP